MGSTLTTELVGFGRGLGAFVVSTYEIVVNKCPSVGFNEVTGGGFLVVVEFLRDVNVVRRFTATVVTTGFLVPAVVVFVGGNFITVVEFLGGFDAGDPVGRLVGLTDVVEIVDTSDVRFKTGFLVPIVGFVFDVTFIVVLFVTFLIESWIVWNVVNFILSVVLCAVSSFKLILFVTLRSIILPSVVEKPPTFTAYFSVVDFFVVIGLFDDATVVVGISSNVLLL